MIHIRKRENIDSFSLRLLVLVEVKKKVHSSNCLRAYCTKPTKNVKFFDRPSDTMLGDRKGQVKPFGPIFSCPEAGFVVSTDSL